jgi:hypothetical protein
MGTGATIFVAAMLGVPAVIGVVSLVGVVRSRPKPRDLSDTIAEQIADMPSSNLDQVNGAPVIGVPALDCLDRLAPWDVDPDVDDAWRLSALHRIESSWALPARERAR